MLSSLVHYGAPLTASGKTIPVPLSAWEWSLAVVARMSRVAEGRCLSYPPPLQPLPPRATRDPTDGLPAAKPQHSGPDGCAGCRPPGSGCPHDGQQRSRRGSRVAYRQGCSGFSLTLRGQHGFALVLRVIPTSRTPDGSFAPAGLRAALTKCATETTAG